MSTTAHAGAIRSRLSWPNRIVMHPLAKPTLFAALSLPMLYLVWAAFADALGANPAQAMVRALGDWTLRALVLALAVTPLRVITGWSALVRLRRMCGLFVAFYASMHLLAYAWLDTGWDWAEVVHDTAKRPFILVGMLAWVLLMVLAATSFNGAVRALGGKAWQRLHRLVYLVAGLAVLHFYWMRSSKNDLTEVSVYAAVFIGLLGWRAWRRWGPR